MIVAFERITVADGRIVEEQLMPCARRHGLAIALPEYGRSAPGRNRTRDLMVRSHPLCPLSYGRASAHSIGQSSDRRRSARSRCGAARSFR